MDRVRNGAEGDYILIGASTDAAPPDEADEIRQIVSSQIRSSDWRTISHLRESDYGR
jgi:hypothetical protein